MNYSGILYRIWAEAGIIILIGIACLLLSGIRTKTFHKQCFLAGVLCVLYGCGTAIYYLSCFLSPRIDYVHGIFYEAQRNSRVAPPLPFTMEYSFSTTDGEKTVFYLDVLSKKEIIPEGFLEGEEYIICYEARTNIIVGVEKSDGLLSPLPGYFTIAYNRRLVYNFIGAFDFTQAIEEAQITSKKQQRTA